MRDHEVAHSSGRKKRKKICCVFFPSFWCVIAASGGQTASTRSKPALIHSNYNFSSYSWVLYDADTLLMGLWCWQGPARKFFKHHLLKFVQASLGYHQPTAALTHRYECTAWPGADLSVIYEYSWVIVITELHIRRSRVHIVFKSFISQ